MMPPLKPRQKNHYYADLPVEMLVQLKALDVTPDYVRSLRAHGLQPLSANQLVRLKAVGFADPDEQQ